MISAAQKGTAAAALATTAAVFMGPPDQPDG
jgi:hypothetical protein